MRFSAITLDDHLIIATERPPAVQSVPWHDAAKNTYTELITKMDWIKEKSPIIQMVFDKPTSLFAWVARDGKAYTVRKPGVT